MWSLGCILFEMIYVSTDYCNSKNYNVHKRYAFQGDSCYPLSPKNEEDESHISDQDQMIQILRYKQLSDHDRSFCTNIEQIEYMDSISQVIKNIPRNTFENTFPHTRLDLIGILDQLLEFNPYFRPTAKEVLKNQIFDDIGAIENERSAEFKIAVPIDKKYPC